MDRLLGRGDGPAHGGGRARRSIIGQQWLRQAFQPDRRIAEENPRSSHVGVGRRLLRRGDCFAECGVGAGEQEPEELAIHRHLAAGRRQRRRRPDRDRPAVGRAHQRFREALFGKETVEEPVQTRHRDDERQTRPVGHRGRIVVGQQVVVPHVDRTVAEIIHDQLPLIHPAEHLRSRAVTAEAAAENFVNAVLGGHQRLESLRRLLEIVAVIVLIGDEQNVPRPSAIRCRLIRQNLRDHGAGLSGIPHG